MAVIHFLPSSLSMQKIKTFLFPPSFGFYGLRGGGAEVYLAGAVQSKMSNTVQKKKKLNKKITLKGSSTLCFIPLKTKNNERVIFVPIEKRLPSMLLQDCGGKGLGRRVLRQPFRCVYFVHQSSAIKIANIYSCCSTPTTRKPKRKLESEVKKVDAKKERKREKISRKKLMKEKGRRSGENRPRRKKKRRGGWGRKRKKNNPEKNRHTHTQRSLYRPDRRS